MCFVTDEQLKHLSLDQDGNIIIFGLKEKPQALDEVLEIYRDFETLGTIEQADKLVISNRVALRLASDGIITKEILDKAREGFDEKSREYIDLPEIEFGSHKITVRILPEKHVGANYIVLVDKNGLEII